MILLLVKHRKIPRKSGCVVGSPPPRATSNTPSSSNLPATSEIKLKLAGPPVLFEL